MSYKAVALFDLDKTLLNPDKQIPQENIAALAALNANHVLPVIATGRNYYELADWMRVGHIQSAIAANGADVFYRDAHIFQSLIGIPQLKRLSAQAAKDGLALAYYNDQRAALSQTTALTQANYQWVHQTPPLTDPAFYLHQAVCMLLIFLAHDEAGDAVAKQYIDAFPEFTFYRNSENTLDIVNAGQSKATGLRLLMQQPELAGLPTYAFGDGNNDIAILQAADHGIAMGNALPQVKAIADYETADYMAGGIVKALQHFHLID
ncbi:Cof-type HAD-IIB family hydrolase [Lacticaseibacillus jixiensis]|uniref:Cof-type HAD-IIB family hydrolase n=1 Tax=Lacticaseibacillus jixiensis TaxID=3231926 RepID=UPI0036F2F43C